MTVSDIDRALLALPKFSTIDPNTIVDKLTELLARNRQELDTLLHEPGTKTWANFVHPFEEIGDRLSRFWSPIGHLHGVSDSDELREAYNSAITMLTDYASELAQSDALAQAFRDIRDSSEFSSLALAQRKVVKNALRDFKLGGIELSEKDRERFRELSAELASLTTQFSENVLDATQAWSKNIQDVHRLAGLPPEAVALVTQNARNKDQQGYTLTLDFPSYMPVMSYCDNRELREEMYTAYVTRASEQGPHAEQFDNTQIIDKILERRYALANLLGFSTYAEYSLAKKMATSTSSVIAFLEDLAARSRSSAEQDYQQLTSFAVNEVGLESLQPWDVAYCTEKLREKAYAFSQQELRPYFPVDRVLSGLFETVRRLFGISVSEIDGVDTWHPSVLCREIRDQHDDLRGIFYLDLFARDHKRGGAWMDECVVRRIGPDGVQYPAAYLTCNFTPPIDGKQSLLTHDEVLTLFHEFGHGIHHMLTLVDHAAVSGINGVPWDGVELPSQFLENWAWEHAALEFISGHVDSGEALSDELYQRMLAAKNFQAGMQMLRQLEFALFDFTLHDQKPGTVSVQTVLDRIREKIAVAKVPAFNRFQHGFSHIFAGGYAAGYYSYKWAEVLSADAFSRFEEEGVFNPETGRSFLECILERGGSEDTMELFKSFRGREPDIEPLLRHAGLSH